MNEIRTEVLQEMEALRNSVRRQNKFPVRWEMPKEMALLLWGESGEEISLDDVEDWRIMGIPVEVSEAAGALTIVSRA